ncbi:MULTISPECIES: MFS transporter [Protofrankia]|uniref:MFS transporter n=1 Tax=Protofrankia TaxID=2994361 RepID=UPI00069BF8F6|nr:MULTISPECIES: MFS transporter [Protofrankia]ONH35531.1 MFS transporter [Protofrankia sp. BMG5.30]
MYLADAYTVPTSAGPGTDPGQQAAAPAARVTPRAVARALPRTVLVLGTVSLLTDVSAEMVTAVLPLYLVAELGLSPLGFGLLDGIYNGFSTLVRLVGGHLADRGGRHKAVAAVGYGLSALCKPALLLAHGVASIGVVLAADRTGKGLRTAPRDAMISLASSAETQGRSFGIHRAMDTAGALLGPIIAFFVMRAAVDGFDALFMVSFCIAMTGVAVLLLFAPGRGHTTDAPGRGHATAGADAAGNAASAPVEDAPASRAREEATVSARAAFGLLRRPDLRWLALCALLLGLATVSDSFLYLMLQRDLAMPREWFPLLPVATAGTFLLLAVPFGQAADRFGRWRVFLAGHVGLLVAYGLLLVPVSDAALLAVVLVLHGAFYAATDGVLMADAAVSVPAQLRSSGLALVQTAQGSARFACSLLFGAAWSAWGDRAALASATVALAVCVTLGAVARPLRALGTAASRGATT